jgi:hypothetical protein
MMMHVELPSGKLGTKSRRRSTRELCDIGGGWRECRLFA